ncbi:MAG TPA: glycosyltransferase family 9 protein [Opitutales bacterium]|nr:glycosyltransferase family 9 protein [Opitutales bacterium]
MNAPVPSLIPLSGREKILLVPVNGIGDGLMYLPAAWQLKRAAPGVKIGLLANRANGAAAALRLARDITVVHEYTLGGHGLADYARFFLAERRRCARVVAGERYDYVATIIPNVFRRSILKLFPVERQLVEPDRLKNEYAAALRTVNRFAGLPPGGGYGQLLNIPEAAPKREELGAPQGRYAVLCLEGKSPARRYPDAAGLGRALAQATGFTAILAGPRPADAVEARESNIRDLRGRADWAGLTALMDGAAVVVAVDGGAMHLAIALAKPVVGLFGPIHSSFRTPPYYPAPWRALDAGPRGADGYERREDYAKPAAVVSQLSVDAIVAAVREVLA